MFASKKFAKVTFCWALASCFFSTAFAQREGSAEKRLLDLANQERRKAGAAALEWDENLAMAAQKHAQLMAEHQQLSHHFAGEPELGVRLSTSGARFDAIAENVGLADSPEDMHNAWTHSTPHRTNMLNKIYTSVGIGVVRGNAQIYVVQDFTRAVTAVSGPQFEQNSLAALNQIRAQHHLPLLTRVNAPAMRQLACSSSNPTSGLGGSQLTSRVELYSYTASNSSDLPAAVVVALRNPNLARAALGACQINADQGFTKYRVQLNLFH